jgi:hypothetical protein
MFVTETTLRTTLDLSEKLIKDLMSSEKGATKSAAIEKAIKDYLRRKRLDVLLSMKGRMKTVDYSCDLRKMEKRSPRSKASIIVTKQSVPIAKLLPITKETDYTPSLHGSVLHENDIISPIKVIW